VEVPTGIARASGMLISGLMRIATSLFPVHRGPSYLWRLIKAHNPNGELLVFLNTRDSFCQQIGDCDRARNCSDNGFVITAATTRSASTLLKFQPDAASTTACIQLQQ
jgi:hypothetical protein